MTTRKPSPINTVVADLAPLAIDASDNSAPGIVLSESDERLLVENAVIVLPKPCSARPARYPRQVAT